MARPLGSETKNKKFLMNRLQAMYGKDFHPIMKMAENAVAIQDIAETDPTDLGARRAAVEAWDKIAPYVEPKLKSVEITGADGGPITITKAERTIVDPKA